MGERERCEVARLLALGDALRVAFRAAPALTVNQATLRVVKFEGESPPLHTHDEDECYVVLEGEIVVEVEGREPTKLARGDAFVVRAGTAHRPHPFPRATVLLVT